MDTMTTISSRIVDIGLSVVKEKITKKQEETELRNRLNDFLIRQHKYNLVCTVEEEIDFQGVAEYICGDLLEEVKMRLFGNAIQRRRARQSIMDKAAFYAQAKTRLSDKRARQLASDSVDILRAFYRSKINRELKFMAAEIEDTVIDEMTTQHQSLGEATADLSRRIDEMSLLSIDRNIPLVQEGNLDLVEKNLSVFLKGISVAHTLPDDFKFGLNERGRLISIPISDDALKRYPPRFSISAKTAKLGDKLLTRIDDYALSQSYRHQIPISLDGVTAKKYLGDVLDPSQVEAEEMTGAHAVLYPPQLPKAFPCNVLIDGCVAVEYLLLRTKEILDDGTAIITNDEQEHFNFIIRISLNPSSDQLLFTVTPTNPTNYEALQYRIILRKASTAKKIVLKSLATNEEFLSAGKLEPIDIARLDSEIEFLDRIVTIEQFWGISICIPQEIKPTDHLLIDRLYSMANHGIYQSKREWFVFKLEVSELTREAINNIEGEKTCSIAYTEDVTVLLFDQPIKFTLLRRIDGAKIDNLDALKKKVARLHDGEEIELKYVPANQGKKMTYYDAVYSNEAEQKLLHSHVI